MTFSFVVITNFYTRIMNVAEASHPQSDLRYGMPRDIASLLAII